MTDRVALILFLVVAGGIALDLAMGWGGTEFMLRKFLVLLDWVMFWR